MNIGNYCRSGTGRLAGSQRGGELESVSQPLSERTSCFHLDVAHGGRPVRRASRPSGVQPS